MPGFCRDCRSDVADDRRPLPGLRLAQGAAASRARPARGRACGLRRVLRHHREARRPFACRQAGDRGRRPARGGAHRLLCGAHLRGALRHADVRGAAAVPVRDRGAARHGEIRPRRRAGAPHHARPHARWSQPVSIDEAFMDLVGHRAPARHARRRSRSPVSPTGSSARSASRCRSGSPATSSWPRSPPISTSRAALRSSAAARPPPSWPPGRSPRFSASARSRRPGLRPTDSAPSATCSAPARPS